MYFNHEDAAGLSQRTTYAGGYLIEEEDIEDSPAELDPLGGNVGYTSPYTRPRSPGGATPGEHLTFLHQDASGASLQQTTETGALEQTCLGYRTAEFDALGNNVGELSLFSNAGQFGGRLKK